MEGRHYEDTGHLPTQREPGTAPPSASEQSNPPGTLILDFQPPDCGQDICVVAHCHAPLTNKHSTLY